KSHQHRTHPIFSPISNPHSDIMPPKRIQVQPASRRAQPKGYFGQIYHTLTSEENASVVISVAMFGVGVFLFVFRQCDDSTRLSFFGAGSRALVWYKALSFENGET